jgi:hypothetical protein
MGDIRVGDLVRLKQDVPLTSLRGQVGIVRGVNIKRGHFGVQFGRTPTLAVYLYEIDAVKRGGQWLTQVDGVWSA